jgi:uncharacterized protein YciI
MYVVLLKFADRSAATRHMAGHKAWLEHGFAEGVFVASGSLHGGLGGAIVAVDGPREALDARIAADPFVEHGVVTAEVLGIDASRADPRLDFLKSPA